VVFKFQRIPQWDKAWKEWKWLNYSQVIHTLIVVSLDILLDIDLSLLIFSILHLIHHFPHRATQLTYLTWTFCIICYLICLIIFFPSMIYMPNKKWMGMIKKIMW
jgi:hypothetical protein